MEEIVEHGSLGESMELPWLVITDSCQLIRRRPLIVPRLVPKHIWHLHLKDLTGYHAPTPE